MSAVFEGRRRSVSLPIGSTLQFTASVGTGNVIRIPNPNNGEPGTPVPLTGSATTIGPFNVVALFTVAADSGRIDYEVVATSGTAVGRLQGAAAPVSLTLLAGRQTSTYLPIGGVLTVDAGVGVGTVIALPNPNNGEPGPVTLFTGTALTFGPFDVPALYRITCGVGAMVLGIAFGLAGGGTPTPSASIISPANYSQPGASTRYYQAVGDRPMTWSKTGGDASTVTLNNMTGIFNLNDGTTGDGLSVGSRSFTLIGTPIDGTSPVSKLITIALTIVAQPGSVSESFVSDFTGTAGTKLATKPGWAISRTGTNPIADPILTGDGKITGVDNYYDQDGNWAILWTPVSSLGGMKVTFNMPAGLANFRRPHLFVGASDYANGIGLRPYCSPNSGGIDVDIGSMFSKQGGPAGTNVTLPFFGYNGYKPDGTIDFVFEFSADANTVTVSSVGSSNLSGTVDITALNKGTKFGLSGISGEPAMETGCYINSITMVKAGTVLAIASQPTYSVTNSASYVVNWSGIKPTRLQHRFYTEQGVAVTPWMTGESVVTGTSSGTVNYVATAPVGGPLVIRFRPLNDIVIEVVATTPVYFLANVAPFTVGMNVRGGSYGQPIIWRKNWGPNCEVQQNGAGGQVLIPYDAIAGVHDMDIIPGTTWDTPTGGMTIVSQDSTAGTLRLSIVDGNGVNNRSINWSGNRPTKFNVIPKAGDTDDVNDVLVAATADLEFIRELDADLINFTPLNSNLTLNTMTTPFYANDIGTGPDLPYQAKTAFHAKKIATHPKYKGAWKLIGATIPMEGVGVGSVRDRAKLEAATVGNRAQFIVEMFNEYPWNDFKGIFRGLVDAVRGGYYGAATKDALQPALTVWAESDGGPAASYVTTGYVAAGNHLVANVYGIGNAVYVAKQNAPIGSPVVNPDGSENAFFHRTNIDMIQAGRRYLMGRMKQAMQIYREEFGAERYASQIGFALMGQAGGSIYDQFAEHRAWDIDTFNAIKYTGNAFYFGPVAVDPYTVTAAQFEAAFRANFELCCSYVRQSVLDSLRMGKIPAMYEGLTHPNFDYYKGNSDSPYYNYFVQWNIYFASDQGRQLLSDIALFMKQTVPGIVMGYDFAGTLPWSLMLSLRDTGNKRYIGWNEGLLRTS